jgi:secondary thiamine-phosphate synthase enzyme
MTVFTGYINIKSEGKNDIIDITNESQRIVEQSNLKNGIMNISNPGSTGGLTTIEYEPGLLNDLPELLEKLIPSNIFYDHDKTWGDGNGHAHLRSALIGTSISLPIINGKLVLGKWQQVIFIDFDTRPRIRNIIVQIVGE